MTNERLDSIGTTIMLGLVFLLPIFFIPVVSVPFQETKLFLLVVGVLVSIIIWTVARLKSNSITIPQEKFVLPLITLPFIALTASLFSGNIMHSIAGQNVDIDTALMSMVLLFGFGAGVYLLNSKDKVVRFYLALIASSLVLFLYQFARLFLGLDFLSFDILVGSTSNLIGKWNDVGIFAGLITLISLITLDLLRPKGSLKIVFYTSFVASLIMLVVVNFSLVWFVLSFVVFLLVVRSFLEDKFFAHKKEGREPGTSGRNSFSGLSLLVLVISVLFIFAGPTFERFSDAQLGISQIEARPSWQSTITVAEEVYSNNFLFGAGPNNFTKEWLLHKSTEINNTPFWNTDFSFGVGIIPTFFITNGVISVVAWILFFALFFWAGIRTFVRLDVKPFDNYLSTSSFLSATFLWLLSILYVPNVMLFFFAFLFSGVFLTAQIDAGRVKQKVFTFSDNLRVGFFGVILLFALLVVSISGLYISVQRYISEIYLEQAVAQINLLGDIKKAEDSISKALLFSETDTIYRANSELLLLEINNIINQGENTQEIQQQFQLVLTQAIENGRLAVSKDEKNYRNWITLGRIYEALIPLNIEGAYDNARISYEQALSLNPKNPGLAINIARTEVLNGNNSVARDRIRDALIMKNDYTNAIYLLSQIEIIEGKVAEAISSIEAASFLTPRDPIVFFQLGILKYSEQDYAGAIEALGRAVLLDGQYANARYFLGLSYYQEGSIENAIIQFSSVKDLNPDNPEVNAILENLKVGRAPFEAAASPTDPFEGFDLPVEEE